MHVCAAVLAVVLGAFNLRRRVRGDRFHRTVGYTWVALMYFVAISSFWIREMNDGRFSWIHLLSILTLVTLTMGVYFAIKKNRRAHRGNMIGTYLGLIGAGIGAVVAPVREIPRTATEDPVVFVGALVAILVFGVGLIVAAWGWSRRRRKPTTIP